MEASDSRPPFPSFDFDVPPQRELPVRAAVETAREHGIVADRCEVLQDGNTLVLRLTESLVARVVQDRDGPRQGTEWFARENAVAAYLAAQSAPVIPLHPELPPGPYECHGYPLNFWQFVQVTADEPEPEATGRTLARCHELLRGFPEPLPELAILTESLELLGTLERRGSFSPVTLQLLQRRLAESLEVLRGLPAQPLHGDAHPGNLLNTTRGLLLTDWEDTFHGPVEWDLASLIWNARVLEGEAELTGRLLAAYEDAGGGYEERTLQRCLVARAAVMCAWYPVLYPDLTEERRSKLERRLEWLAAVRAV